MVKYKDKKVLVVDDSLTAVAAFRRALIEIGYAPEAVYIARDRKGAIDVAKKRLPDIVFMDTELEVINPLKPQPNGVQGYDTAKAIRELPGMENVRVVAMSSEMDKHRDDWKDAKPDRYLPLDFTDYYQFRNSVKKSIEDLVRD